MDRSKLLFDNLPTEILFIIFKKLDNLEVLYSLYGIDHQRLDFFLQGKTFSHTLNLTYTSTSYNVLPLLRRMSNLKQLNLDMAFDNRYKIIDRTEINEIC